VKLERALEINIIHNDHNPNITDAERNQAHQLGIEALKRFRQQRQDPHCRGFYKLPVETEELKRR